MEAVFNVMSLISKDVCSKSRYRDILIIVRENREGIRI